MEELNTCHQCRQRTKNFAAICKNQKEGKPCKLKFCQKCLLNRYGEKAEEVDRLNNWNCPKCRNECNCSVCLKRKGHKPTGKLVRAAKAKGYSSVSQMLAAKGEEILESVSASNEIATTTSEKEMEAVPSREQVRQESPPDSVKKPKKTKREHKEKAKWTSNFMCFKAFREDANEERVIKEAVKEEACQSTVVIDGDENFKSEDIILPTGTVLTEILDIEFAPENVGNVLQFLEFCKTFGEVVDMKKGEAEAILRQLVHKHNLRRGENYLVTQFQMRLLTLILSESGNGSPSFSPNDGKNSWFEALVKLISRSDLALKELQLGSLMEGIDKYYELDLSKKLRLLNFLCDEAVGTEKLRSFIGDQNSKFFEDMKEAKAKVAAAMEKEKSLKQKLHDEEAKANVSENKDTLPTCEQEALLTQMRSEAAEAHAEMIEAKGMVPKRKQRSNTLRTEPVFLDCNGQRFWKLKCYGDEDAFFMQEIKIQDAVEERWFVYGTEKKHEIEVYISSRAKMAKKSKIHDDNSESNIDEGVEIQNDSCTLRDDCSEANMAEKPEISNDSCTPTDDNSKVNM